MSCEIITIDITEGTDEIQLNICEGAVLFETNAIHDNISNEISAITEKTILSDNDLILIEDSEALFIKKKVKKSSLSGGEANTASNAGTGAGLSMIKVGIDLPLKSLIFFGASVVENPNDITITISPSDSTKIQDTAGTTYLDSEDATYPNQLIGKSTQTGTDKMHQLFNGGGTPSFQVDGGGSLFNNGNSVIVATALTSYFIGTNNDDSLAVGVHNTVTGNNAGGSMLSGARDNSIYGSNAGASLNLGDKNTLIGAYSGANGNMNDCVYIGFSAGINNNGSGCIFIGSNVGAKQTGNSNRLLLSNQTYVNEATELTNSIIRGEMGVTPAVQELYFNSQRINMAYLPTSASGLITGDLWNNSGILTIA